MRRECRREPWSRDASKIISAIRDFFGTAVTRIVHMTAGSRENTRLLREDAVIGLEMKRELQW